MGLKDIGKIVANQTRLEKFNEANPVAPKSPKQEREDDKRFAHIDTTPFTAKPADTTGHVGFKFDSKNPFHRDILDTLVNNGDDGDLVISSRGVSIPKSVAYSEKYRHKFATAAETGEGGEFRFEGEATKSVARKVDKTRPVASRPAAPKISKTATSKKAVAPAPRTTPTPEIKEDLRNLFTGAKVKVDPEIAAKRAAEKAAAEAKEKKARAAERKRRLKED